ncbi:retrovirus-related Pol polyprotein from transposon 297 [Trichonephila clavipes]|nr:retrovirus-related Pol polyprotein from transposon 297 [Trichonephila clavipes]
MALSDSLPQINLGIQGETQGGPLSGAQRVNSEFRVGSSFRIMPEQYFSGVEKVAEFLGNIDNNLTYYEIPTQLACAYLKGHLTGRALERFEVLGYRVVEDKTMDYAHLKQALTEQFPVVRNSRLEPQILDYVEFRHSQTPSNLLQIIDKYEERFVNRKIREFRDTNQSENNRFPNRNTQENLRKTRGNTRYTYNSRPWREFNRFEGQGVADNRRFDGRRRSGQSDNRFHNQGGRQGGSRISAFRDQPGLTHVLYHEIDTGDKGPAVSRPYRYDKIKQGIIHYHIEKMLQEEAYRFAIDYRKLNAITKYPRYPLPVIDDLITNIPHTGIMSTLDLKSGYFQLAISSKDIEKTAFITRNRTFTFLRMPFGLSGVALNFQKAIDIILKPVIGRFVMVYMNDVIITSPSFNEHIDHLNQVITDHAVLTKLTNGKNLSSRMIRWALKLSEFNIEWEHRTGVQNVVVDVLSRNTEANMDGSQISCAALRALALNSREQLIREQREDPELGNIYRYLENPDDGSINATVCENSSQDFKLIDGLLFYAKYSTTLGELSVHSYNSSRSNNARIS